MKGGSHRVCELQSSRPASLGKTRPVLKWAGGKRQLLPHLLKAIPHSFRRYIEPMVGGGALFFALSPERAVIADSNPELINFYKVLVSDLDGLASAASQWKVDRTAFYTVRELRFENLDPIVAAARLLYLNRTCFNGLYRVNRFGHFNVPCGNYASPKIVDMDILRAARSCLERTLIVLGDYKDVVRKHAVSGDVIFLDPPYVPISKYSDFKRYTRQQFRENDHHEMRSVVEELRDRGCTPVITNSNHPLIRKLYAGFQVQLVRSQRNINSRGDGRVGQDIIITLPT